MKLFVVGNGFDLHLGLPTQLRDFGEFVQRQNKWMFHDLSGLHQLTARGGDKDALSLWNQLEDRLSNIDEAFLHEQASYSFSRLEGREALETDYWGYLVEYLDELIQTIINELPSLLKDWVSSIEITDADEITIREYQNFGQRNDEALFVNFNYTNVLEEICGIGNVLHIHGSLSSNHLILGHNASFERPVVKPGDINEAEEIYPFIEQYNEFFRKRHSENIRKLISFVQIASYQREIDEIIVCGHSVGAADRQYFIQIASLFPDADWTFTPHSQGDRENIRKFTCLGFPEGAVVRYMNLNEVIRGG